jgi:hypothetical protein
LSSNGEGEDDRERGREHGERHSARPQPRNGRSHDPDRQSPEEPDVVRVVVASDDSDRQVRPGDEEGGQKREAETGAIGPAARHPDGELEQAAERAEHESPGDEIGVVPIHLGRELHGERG